MLLYFGSTAVSSTRRLYIHGGMVSKPNTVDRNIFNIHDVTYYMLIRVSWAQTIFIYLWVRI